MSRVGQDTLRSILAENSLCSLSLGYTSLHTQGSRGSAENPRAWGEWDVCSWWGGNNSDLGENKEHQELSGYRHTPRSHRCLPECPQQGRCLRA